MNADQAKFLATQIGQSLQAEWKTTYKVLAAVPDGKKDWKPESNSRSAWELATHIASVDVGFLDGVVNLSYGKGFPDPKSTTIAQLTDWYKHEFPKALERTLALEGAHFTQIVDFFGMKLPAVSFMMFCNNHMIHHRGQLATYLRPMGGKVPSIYGGSFDEKFQA